MWTTGWNKNNVLVLYGNLVFNFVPPCSLRNRLICVLIPPFNTDNFSITILAKIQSSSSMHERLDLTVSKSCENQIKLSFLKPILKLYFLFFSLLNAQSSLQVYPSPFSTQQVWIQFVLSKRFINFLTLSRSPKSHRQWITETIHTIAKAKCCARWLLEFRVD